jgi:hypothetical protein
MTNDLLKRLREPDEAVSYEDLCEAADRIEQLEAALREIYEVYAGSEGIPQPISASEGYLFQLIKDMVAISSAALAGEKKDG